MAKETDKQVQELFKVVQQKKSEIAKIEKPNWITNCSFRFSKSTSENVNLQVTADINELVGILAFLMDREQSFKQAADALGVSVKFEWFGHSVEDWKHDIQARINKINIHNKRKELEALEARLNALVSPELRAEWELEEIKKLLGTNE